MPLRNRGLLLRSSNDECTLSTVEKVLDFVNYPFVKGANGISRAYARQDSL